MMRRLDLLEDLKTPVCPFYTPREGRLCKFTDQNDLGGGATLAHWTEEKGA